MAPITAYCLKGHTTSGLTTAEVHQKGGCIALSRKLAKDLGLYRGPRKYDYRFGAIIEVAGGGRFISLILCRRNGKDIEWTYIFPA